MEIHQLRYFVAVAELLSFTKAATRCHVSQPSLSQQIQKLEQDLGVQLLDRLGRRVKLTDAGDAFYERAAAVLDAVDDAKTCVQSSLDWQKGAITVGAIHTIAPYLLPEVVRRLIQRFPEAQITVEEQLTEELIANCLAGELDVGIVALPIAEQRVRAEPLFTEQLVAAAPLDSPLAKKKRVTLNDVTSQPFVLLDDMHCLGRQTLQFCADRNCTPTVSCRTAQLLTVQELVALGQGVSLVPEMAASRNQDRRIVYLPLADKAVEREIGMIWRPRFRPRRLVEAALEVLREFGRENTPQRQRTRAPQADAARASRSSAARKSDSGRPTRAAGARRRKS
jgi:LysR family hydrogen peroxide-inducible transcriptional activator